MTVSCPWPESRFCRILSSQPGPRREEALFATLERLLPVRFDWGKPNCADPAGEICIRARQEDGGDGRIDGVPRLSVESRDPHAPGEARLAETEVTFADAPEVPQPFRGRRVRTNLPADTRFLAAHGNEQVLAACRQGPLWTLSEAAGAKLFRSGLPLPRLADTQTFSDVFSGERFLEMLPLLHFLREMGAGRRAPPLRAAYIIDDPNLHWSSYGCVDYREIATHALRENYHVAFATIPLDTWFTHIATADLFRSHAQHLSLLVHGNNHAKEELAGHYSPAARDSLLRQAIGRIARLEQRGRLRVCRVMVPPHGACSSGMLAALPRNGFESACISAGSLRAHNRDQPWTRTLGFFPSEIIEDCPVLPRWGLAGNVENTLLVAAYLGRPMILRGHHRDLKDGVDVLNGYARFINGLGNVHWSKLSDLNRLNYLWRTEGPTLHVTPLATRVSIDVPENSTEVIIEATGGREGLTWRIAGRGGSFQSVLAGEPARLADAMGRRISIERLGSPQPIVASENPGRASARLVCRRILAEARDRLWV